jgi:hypothetical protein
MIPVHIFNPYVFRIHVNVILVSFSLRIYLIKLCKQFSSLPWALTNMTFTSDISLDVVYWLGVVQLLKATYFVFEDGISFGVGTSSAQDCSGRDSSSWRGTAHSDSLATKKIIVWSRSFTSYTKCFNHHPVMHYMYLKLTETSKWDIIQNSATTVGHERT